MVLKTVLVDTDQMDMFASSDRVTLAAASAAALLLTGIAAAPAASAAGVKAAVVSSPTFVVKGVAGLTAKQRAHLAREHSARAVRAASTSSSTRSVSAGIVDATLTFARRCAPMTLTLSQNGSTLVRRSGASPVVASTLVANGTLTTKVTGSSCKSSFSLAVVNTPTDLAPAPEPAPVPVPSTTSPVPVPSTTSPVPVPSTTSPVPVPSTTSPVPVPSTTSPAPVPSTTSPAPVPSTTSPVPVPSTTSPVPVPSTTSPVPVPSTTSPAPTPTQTGVSVLTFGAVGNGVVDDTAAIQQALNTVGSGQTLVFPAGYTFAHSAVLRASKAGARLTGGGTLLATREATSSFWISASNVTVDNLTFRMASTTQRWETYDQMKVRVVNGTTGVSMSNVMIDGSAAAGVYVGGATNFTLTDVTVRNTRADGIHMTDGSTHGRVVRPTIQNVGDDGVAVVSYIPDGAVVSDIRVESPRFLGQTWGRGLSVVGGTDVTFTDVYVEASAAAAIYIAAEPEWNTYGVARVLVDGGTIKRANQLASVDHGAIMIYAAQAGAEVRDVTMRNLRIEDTRVGASDQVRVLAFNGATGSRLAFQNIAIWRGPTSLLVNLLPSTALSRTGWTFNGSPVPDMVGWV